MLKLTTYNAYPATHVRKEITERSASNWLKRNADVITMAWVTYDGSHSIAVVHTSHDYKGKKLTISGRSEEVADYVVKRLRNVKLQGWGGAPRWFLERIFTFTPHTHDMLCEGFDISFDYVGEHYIGTLRIMGDTAASLGDTAVYIDSRHTLYVTLKNITNVERITRK